MGPAWWLACNDRAGTLVNHRAMFIGFVSGLTKRSEPGFSSLCIPAPSGELVRGVFLGLGFAEASAVRNFCTFCNALGIVRRLQTDVDQLIRGLG
jgi:hypothetical protein